MATGPEMSAISSSSDDAEIRILLMGRRGSGKSSSGNTILTKNVFKVRKKEGKICDVTAKVEEKVTVIECPDLLDPDLSKEKLEELKEQLVSQCSAGLSAVLLTVPLVEPVQNEEEILDYIKRLFGPKVQEYIMILFTRTDELDETDEPDESDESDESDKPQTIDEYLQSHEDLQRLVTECVKFHCFSNKNKSVDQVQELLQKIERMREDNGGKLIMEQMKRKSSKDDLEVDFSGESSSEDPDVTDVIPEKTDLRLVLLGKTGAGKSATGNTIIGRKVFKSSAYSKSQTKQCQIETTERMGKEISVIDTPGLYDTVLSAEEVNTELVKCITHASPGPHAFIIVIKVGRFTEEEKNTIKQLKELFGEKIEKYTMIIFTHEDQLKEEKKDIEQFLNNADSDLQPFVQSCGNRFFGMSNTSASFPQFKDLIRKIETMVAENGGTHFSNDMFEGTEKCIQEIQKQKLDEKVKQYKQQKKSVTQTEWQKIYWQLVEESRREAEISFSERFLSYLVTSPLERIAEACMEGLASLLNRVKVTPEEKESAIREAQSLGISRIKAVRLAVRATVKQAMCVIQ